MAVETPLAIPQALKLYPCANKIVEKNAIGFINFIVYPIWDLIYRITPEALPYISNIKMNLKRFEEKVKEKNKV